MNGFTEESYLSFKEAALDKYDFVTCIRGDGSYYGNGGTKCNKGTLATKKDLAAEKKKARAGDKKAAANVKKMEKSGVGGGGSSAPAPAASAPAKPTPAPAAPAVRTKDVVRGEMDAIKEEFEAKRTEMMKAQDEGEWGKAGELQRRLGELNNKENDLRSELSKAPTEASAGDSKPTLSSRYDGSKPLGEGGYAQVRVTADGTIIKKGEIGKEEVAVQKKLEGVDGIPKIKNAEGNIIEMERARGTALMDSDVMGQAMGSGANKQTAAAADDVVRVLKETHQRGVSHGDLHDGNVYVSNDGKAGLIDFGAGRVSSASALNEGLGFGRDYKSGWMEDMAGGSNAGPRWAQMQSNQASVSQAVRDAGYDPNKDLGEQGMSGAEAKRFVDQLYDGV